MPMVRSDNRKALLEAVRERYGNQPIVRQALLPILCLLFCVTILLAFGAFKVERRDQLSEVVKSLRAFNEEQVRKNNARFNAIATLHRKATDLFNLSLSHVDGQELQSQFDTLFPEFGDGTRRSSPGLYEGTADTRGGVTYGIGAFLGGANAMTLEDKRQILAAYQVVRSLRSLDGGFKSFFYFTPTNRLVVFAPSRHDRLMFYRRQAPANFDFRREEFVSITTPENNPSRRMRCTGLQRIIYDRTGQTWTTGCMTPVDLGGRHVGSWGTSVPLDDLMPANDLNDVPGTGVILISREGRLIHHPRYTHQRRSGPESMLDLTTTRDPQLAALWAFVQQHRDGNYLGEALDSFVAMRRIDTPGWYALVVQDPSVMQAESNRLILRIAITAAICLVLQALAITWLLRRRVGVPLARLIERTRTLTRRVPNARFVDVDRVAQRDEVAQLTHDFDIMAERIGSAQSELERKVADRTKALRRANLQLKLIATRDPLTGIPSRRHLASEIDARLAVLGGEGHYLLAFDVDHLKRVNEVHGEETGDRALINIANGIAALLREGDLCGRIGGAEFAAFVRADTQAEAMNVVERVRTGLYGLETPGRYGEMVRVTVSAGVTGATAGDRFDALLLRADEALTEAKQGGRDRAIWHRPVGRRHNAIQRAS